MPGSPRRDGFLEDRGDRLVLRPRLEGLLGLPYALAFVVAPAVLAAASLSAWVTAAGDGRAFLVGWALGAALAAALALAGLVGLATARGRRERAAVRLDLAERLLVRDEGSPEVLRGVRGVLVRGARGRWALELTHDDGRGTPLLRAPRGDGRALADAADHLADALGVEAEVPRSAPAARPLLPRRPPVAGALCYAPLDGVLVLASVYYLMGSTDPFVRFSAKQSLIGLAAEGLAALLVIGCCGLPVALVLPPALAVAVPLLCLAVVRVGVRTLAAVRAHRGMVWVQPWLAPLSRRWAPPPP